METVTKTGHDSGRLLLLRRTSSGRTLMAYMCLIVSISSTKFATALAREDALSCNQSLAPGSVLTMSKKLDTSGKFTGDRDPFVCEIRGPKAGPPATIVLPHNDCGLHAGSGVVLSGHLVFVAGYARDCCGDGEGHGAVLCTDHHGDLVFANDSVVTVHAKDGQIVGPGGFWSDGGIEVHGAVNATLPHGMSGVFGLLGCYDGGNKRGVVVSENAAVVVRGPRVRLINSQGIVPLYCFLTRHFDCSIAGN